MTFKVWTKWDTKVLILNFICRKFSSCWGENDAFKVMFQMLETKDNVMLWLTREVEEKNDIKYVGVIELLEGQKHTNVLIFLIHDIRSALKNSTVQLKLEILTNTNRNFRFSKTESMGV